VVGFDACKRGWAAVVLRPGQPVEAHFVAAIGGITVLVPDLEVIAIDIPIGLLDSGMRRADLAAKAVLGSRRSSVFMTPVRAAIEAASHAEATAISVTHSGLGISQQSYALRAKILEVDRWLADAPCPVYEVHPEVSFTELLGHPARATKKSWQGAVERRAALATVGIDLDEIDPAVGALIGSDDMLDAAVVDGNPAPRRYRPSPPGSARRTRPRRPPDRDLGLGSWAEDDFELCVHHSVVARLGGAYQ
jgi:predicted RNase H-like nuclease